MLGLNYNIVLSNIQFWVLFLGVNITFFPQHFLGLQGMPRRISDYPDAYTGWNLISSLGSIISVIAAWLFLYIISLQLSERQQANRFPWLIPQFYSDSLRILLNRSYNSLEWSLSSPPKPHAFMSLPVQSNILFNVNNEVVSPLDQFNIQDYIYLSAPILGNLNISLTNMAFYLILSLFIILNLNILTTNYNKLVSNNWSIGLESLYATIHSIVINQINSTTGQKYYPFIFTLFIFILINNLIGMVPYSFAPTSHFVLTFALSFTIVLGATILGFQKHNLKFFISACWMSFSFITFIGINRIYFLLSKKYFTRT